MYEVVPFLTSEWNCNKPPNECLMEKHCLSLLVNTTEVVLSKIYLDCVEAYHHLQYIWGNTYIMQRQLVLMIMISTPHNLYICSGYNDCNNYERILMGIPQHTTYCQLQHLKSTEHSTHCNLYKYIKLYHSVDSFTNERASDVEILQLPSPISFMLLLLTGAHILFSEVE